MGKIAFVFSGQGAQKPGMGLSLYESAPAAREVFDRLEALRPGLQELCFRGEAEELGITKNTQPALFAVELAAAAALRAAGVEPSMDAGFSLGEITALTDSGAADAETGLHLVCRRAELMQADAEANPGGMAAVLKLTDEQVEAVCAGIEGAYPVNYNCPGQVSVACKKESLPELSAAVKAAGGRAVPLKVSGGFHSPYMARAAAAFGEAVRAETLREPALPLYSDYTALPYEGDFAELLSRQICNPVRWQSLMKNMIAAGADTFVELGPGKTLCGLINKIDPAVRTLHVEDAESLLETVKEAGAC